MSPWTDNRFISALYFAAKAVYRRKIAKLNAVAYLLERLSLSVADPENCIKHADAARILKAGCSHYPNTLLRHPTLTPLVLPFRNRVLRPWVFRNGVLICYVVRHVGSRGLCLCSRGRQPPRRKRYWPPQTCRHLRRGAWSTRARRKDEQPPVDSYSCGTYRSR